VNRLTILPLIFIPWAILAVAGGACVLSWLPGCGGPAWTSADTTAHAKAVNAGRTLVSVCRSDAGCSPQTCAVVVEAIDCNIGSSLYSHGGPNMLPDAGCQ
jgi:hypothetical protein